MLEYLVKKNVKIDKPLAKTKATPLSIACYKGYLECARLLINNGAKVNNKTSNMTPLYLAARQHKYAIVEYLANLESVIEHMETSKENNAFWLAVEQKDIHLLSILLQHNANPGTLSKIGETPLVYTRRNNNLEIEKLLLTYVQEDSSPCVEPAPPVKEKVKITVVIHEPEDQEKVAQVRLDNQNIRKAKRGSRLSKCASLTGENINELIQHKKAVQLKEEEVIKALPQLLRHASDLGNIKIRSEVPRKLIQENLPKPGKLKDKMHWYHIGRKSMDHTDLRPHVEELEEEEEENMSFECLSNFSGNNHLILEDLPLFEDSIQKPPISFGSPPKAKEIEENSFKSNKIQNFYKSSSSLSLTPKSNEKYRTMNQNKHSKSSISNKYDKNPSLGFLPLINEKKNTKLSTPRTNKRKIEKILRTTISNSQDHSTEYPHDVALPAFNLGNGIDRLVNKKKYNKGNRNYTMLSPKMKKEQVFQIYGGGKNKNKLNADKELIKGLYQKIGNLGRLTSKNIKITKGTFKP